MLYLSTLQQAINVCRNQPHVITFTAADQDGDAVDLSSVTSAYLIFSLASFNDQPWPWPGFHPSIIKRFDAGFTLGNPAITFELTEALIGELALGQMIYEFGVSEDDTQFIVCQQGTLTVAQSLWSPI